MDTPLPDMASTGWDSSGAGMVGSAGMMVKYVYRLGEVERNHEAYVREHRIVAAQRIEALAKESLLGGHAPGSHR
jgi:malonyl-CoA decarboxylase